MLSVGREAVSKPAGFVVDLSGALTRVHYWQGLASQGEAPFEQRHVVPALPPFNEAYFEWVDVLESVRAASGRYVICELGAGWGRWCVRAACALRRLNPMPFRCIAAEAEPEHYRWMREHFVDNGIDPAQQELVWAAVGPTAGIVPFHTGDPGGWYGQSVADSPPPAIDPRARRRLRARGLLGRPPRAAEPRGVSWVPMVTLFELIGEEPRVDLLDLDVQGMEFEVLDAASRLVDARVRRVHVGTHSMAIEDGLRRLFFGLGWECLNDYSCNSVVQTPYGDISFQDGVQSWVNPRMGGD